MSTKIALSIFSYQISNYPKKLIWQTNDQAILEFLDSVGFVVKNLGQINHSTVTNVDSVDLESQAATQTEVKTGDLQTTSPSDPDRTFNGQNNSQLAREEKGVSVDAKSDYLYTSAPKSKLTQDNSTNWADSSNQAVNRGVSSNSSLILVTSKARSLLEFKQKVQVSAGNAANNPILENSKPTQPEIDNHSKTTASSELTTKVKSAGNVDASIRFEVPPKPVNDFNLWQDWLTNRQSTPKLNLDNLTKQTQYQSNKLFQDNHFHTTQDQDLDQWLAKIKHTKQTIDSSKLANSKAVKSNTQIVSFQPKTKATKIVKRLYLFTSALLSLFL